MRALLLISLFASICAAQPNEPKHVLLLMQEDASWPIFREIDENVRATLVRGFPEGILIFSEHMDRTHFPDPVVQAQREAGILHKYLNFKLDLVIEVGDFPLDLFPKVPLIHISLSPLPAEKRRLASPENDAAIWIEPGVRRTVEAARRFRPNARQIVVIAGTSPSEKMLLDQVRERLSGYSNQLQIIYLTNLGFAAISKEVETLGTESIVLFVGLARDGDGKSFISANVLSKISAVSGAPVFTLFDNQIGSGAVGGFVTRFDEVGRLAGEMGLRFIAGQLPKDVIARSDYVFDWRQLKRWKFSESALPADSIVLNRQPNIWETYKYYLLGAIFLGVAQTLLIAGLLWQRAKKRKLQRHLVAQMAFDKMLAELSSTFINLPEDKVGLTIEKSIGRIAQFLKLDRITLFEYSPANTELKVTHSWHSAETDIVPPVIDTERLPWLITPLMRGETVLVSDLEVLPAEAVEEKEHLSGLGTLSVATVPLKAGDDFFGCISFASTRRRVLWTPNLVEQLKLLAEIFSNALMRRRAQEDRLNHASVVASAMDAIVSVDDTQKIVLFNAAAEKMFDCKSQDAVGSPIDRFIPKRFRAAHNTRIRNFGETGSSSRALGTLWALKANGDEFPIEASISHTDISGKTLFTVIIRDITDRRHAEHVLRESEDRFRLVANSAPVLIWMSGGDKLCTFFNQGWLKFTGRPLEQELGTGWLSAVYPGDREQCFRVFSAAFDARVDFEMEYRLRRFDGEYRWIVDFGVPRFESDGTFCGYIGSCVDITDRKSAEETLHSLTGRLITAQEEERARIARELHDDFSQRLALFGISLGQLWDKLSPEEVEQRASVAEMLNGIKEMSSDIHTLSHQLHSSKLEHVGLVPALHGLCREISQKYKIDVEFRDCQLPREIPKDVALCLFRIAQEALGNVVKHSKAKAAQVELGSNEMGLSLRVSDQGKGFDPNTKNSRAGIGLIGMAERLRLVGGRLFVKSEPDCGTAVTGEVPLVAGTNQSQEKANAATN